jgi:hypothetical protein
LLFCNRPFGYTPPSRYNEVGNIRKFNPGKQRNKENKLARTKTCVSPSVQAYSIVSLKGSKGYFRKLSSRASLEIQSFSTKPQKTVRKFETSTAEWRRSGCKTLKSHLAVKSELIAAYIRIYVIGRSKIRVNSPCLN